MNDFYVNENVSYKTFFNHFSLPMNFIPKRTSEIAYTRIEKKSFLGKFLFKLYCLCKYRNRLTRKTRP